GASPENVAETENIAENVGQIGKARGTVESISSHAGDALMAEAVIGRAFLRIAEDAVGFRGLFEFLLGCVIARVAIGVILQGEFAVRPLQILVVTIPAHAENLVIIAFSHTHSDAGLTATFTMAGRSSRPLKLYPR